MEKIELGKIGKLTITRELQEIIDSLHRIIGSKEWSGVLFYRLTKGKLENMKDLEFEGTFAYLMDIGTHGSTEFEYDSDIVKAEDQYKDADKCKTGLIHTHHNMSAFFSNTDVDELMNNSVHYNYYLSLVVCSSGDYEARVAFPGKTTVKYSTTFKDTKGQPYKKYFTSNVEAAYVGELEVIAKKAPLGPKWIVDRVSEVEKKKAEKEKEKYKNTSRYTPVKGFHDSTDYGKYADNFNYSTGINNQLEQFIVSLLYVDADKKYIRVERALEKLKDMTDVDLDIFESMLDSGNIEIIYSNIYKGDPTYLRLEITCMEAMVYLEDNCSAYKDLPVYSTLKECLHAACL